VPARAAAAAAGAPADAGDRAAPATRGDAAPDHNAAHRAA